MNRLPLKFYCGGKSLRRCGARILMYWRVHCGSALRVFSRFAHRSEFQRKSVIGTVCAVLSLACLTASAKNLGNYGEVFPVIEQDIRQIIMQRLHQMDASGELERRKKEIVQRVAEHVMRPKPLNLDTTTTPSVFRVDPTITANQDIFLPDGTLVARAGTRLNPFATIHFSKTLIFFNGDDKAQLAWVKAHYQDYREVKFILTGGDIRDASESFGRVYFDLDGKLTQQLQIRHVPSVVSQDGLVWRIQEIGVL